MISQYFTVLGELCPPSREVSRQKTTGSYFIIVSVEESPSARTHWASDQNDKSPGVHFQRRYVLAVKLRRGQVESYDAVIRVYDEAGNVIEVRKHAGDFKK